MEDGYIILVFIAIAVIQGIGQKRRQEAKKRQQRMGAPPRPSQRPPAHPEPEPDDVPAPSETAKAGGSEGLIPSDVWEEILGLARGTAQPPKTETAPSEAAGKPQAPPRSLEVQRREEDSPPSRSLEPPVRDRRPRPRSPDKIRRPSGTAPKKKELVPASPAVPAAVSATLESGRGVAEARAQLFGTGSVEELRKAIILKEVLGPPLALRDEAG